jgi:hypothetical protein
MEVPIEVETKEGNKTGKCFFLCCKLHQNYSKGKFRTGLKLHFHCFMFPTIYTILLGLP